jgi:hypothetical protein
MIIMGGVSVGGGVIPELWCYSLHIRANTSMAIVMVSTRPLLLQPSHAKGVVSLLTELPNNPKNSSLKLGQFVILKKSKQQCIQDKSN